MEIRQLEEGIASLCIATDESPYIDHLFLPALTKAVASLEQDTTVRAILVEGGDRYFSAGASRSALLSTDQATAVPSYVTQVPRVLLRLPVPTIACMRGHAIGGGFILGLWCDSAVLAEESMYGANFMQLGLTPGMGSTTVLEQAVGAPLARELLFTGRLLKGRELKSAGVPIAHAIVAREQVQERALNIAREIADVPRGSLVLLKKTLAARRLKQLEQALEAEQEMHRIIFDQTETYNEIAQRYAGLNGNGNAEEG